MLKPDLTMTRQSAQAIVFEQRQTGHILKVATLRLNEDVPVVSRHEGLEPPTELWKEVDDLDPTEDAMRLSRGGAAFAVHRQ